MGVVDEIGMSLSSMYKGTCVSCLTKVVVLQGFVLHWCNQDKEPDEAQLAVAAARDRRMKREHGGVLGEAAAEKDVQQPQEDAVGRPCAPVQRRSLCVGTPRPRHSNTTN